MAVRVTRESFEAFVKSMRAVEDRIQKVELEDVQELGRYAVGYLKSIFPRAKGRRLTFEPGARRPTNRGTPLWSGWRSYPTSTNGNVGFLIKHARMGQERIATVLASLDQGAEAHTIQLQNAQAFRFKVPLGIILRYKGKRTESGILIPARKPQPGPDGYIRPTQDYIEEQIEMLRIRAAADIEASFTRKQARYSHIADSARRVRVKTVFGG